MSRVFKIGFGSLEWLWSLLALNIPIFFKNNAMKKTKICSIKNILTAATVFSQGNTYMARIRNSREADFYVRSQGLHFPNICSLQISSRDWWRVRGNILKSHGFYRFFLNRNVIRFYFHFLQIMLFHPLCYLKCTLCWLENYNEFSRFFLCRQLYRLKYTKRNALDLAEFPNQIDYKTFLRD